MLHWSLTALVVGMLAALLGMVQQSELLTGVGQFCLVVFLVLFILWLFISSGGGGQPPEDHY